MSDIVLNSTFKLEIMRVGDEQTPVLVFDDALVDTDELIEQGCQQTTFTPDQNAGYPGIRAPLPADYRNSVLSQLVPLLYQTYRIPRQLKCRVIFDLYSLLTLPPEDLSLLQRIPHFDSNKQFYFASVHYLSPGSFAGTGIFRHRPTGFERINERRYHDYIRAAKSYMEKYGTPGTKYINASTDHYELIAEIEYKPNRLVVYPGNLLHSGLVDPKRDINDDPGSGRLTANLFLDFERPSR